MPFTIYALFDEREPEAVRYIGFSRSVERRLKSHLYAAQHDERSHKASWIRSVLAAGARVLWRTLSVVDTAEAAAQTEIAAVADHLARGCRLTNGTSGGEGVQGFGGVLAPEAAARKAESMRTPEYRELRSEHSRRYWSSQESRDEHRVKMEAFWASPEGEAAKKANSEFTKAQLANPDYKGGPRTPESREKMRQAKLGKPGPPRTEEWKAKISAAQKGKTRRPWTAEERERHMAARARPEVRAKMSASAKARKDRRGRSD